MKERHGKDPFKAKGRDMVVSDSWPLDGGGFRAVRARRPDVLGSGM